MDRFPPGSRDFVLQEILALESRRIDAHIFSLGRPDGRIDEVAFALGRVRGPVDYFLDEGETSEAATRSSLPANETTSGAARWIAIEIGARGIEHLHAHGAVPTEVAREAARLAGVGYSFTVHPDSVCGGADLPSVRESILEAKFVLTQSDFDRERLLAIGGPDAATKLHGIRLRVHPAEWRVPGAEPEDSDAILTIGPPIEKSGFMDLVEAVGTLRDRGRVVRVTIVGQGELEATLRARVESLGLADRIRVIGAASRRELAVLMQTHTVLVLPWLADDRDRDALASIVTDAMSAGLLVVSTDQPGIHDLIEDGVSGRVIGAHNPRWLAGALETLFANPEVREGMARRARTKVEQRLTIARTALHLAKLFFESVTRERLTT